MNDDFERTVVEVRADSEGFARDVANMRALLEDTLGAGAAAAGRGIESALARAARSGKLEFEDLARAAARALGEIAASALSVGGAGGGAGLLAGLAGSLLGLPGRATGGPVGPGRAYLVGERGPELFVPTSSGRVEPAEGRAGPVIHVNVQVSASGGPAAPEMLARTGAQVAQSVRRALFRAEY